MCTEVHSTLNNGVKVDEQIQTVDFNLGKFMKAKDATVICTLLFPQYIFINKFDPGPSGPQPHNFILSNGERLNTTVYAVPDEFDNLNWYNISTPFL